MGTQGVDTKVAVEQRESIVAAFDQAMHAWASDAALEESVHNKALNKDYPNIGSTVFGRS